VTIAAVVDGVEVVPHDLHRGLRIVAIDVRERPRIHVLRRRARPHVDDRSVAAHVVATAIGVQGLFEDGVLADAFDAPVTDAVAEVPLAIEGDCCQFSRLSSLPGDSCAAASVPDSQKSASVVAARIS
jgi:hypothetical protein